VQNNPEPQLASHHNRHSSPHPSPSVAAHSDLDSHTAWSRFVAFVNEKLPSLGSILEHGSPLKQENGLMEIGFPSGSYYLISAQDADFAAELKPLARQFTGVDTLIRVKPITSDFGDTPTSIAEKKKCDHEKRMEELRLEVQKHPLVLEAQRVFGVGITDTKEF
jgi:DNA polymerase-3 subunit gamma/tau